MSRSVLRVGAVMALALLGDALLYLALPAYAERLGLPLWTVGILLSANRVVRLATNDGAAWGFSRVGRRSLVVAASVGAVVTTSLYGLTIFFPVLLLARLAWGACYSVLRLGGLLTVLETSTPRTRGRLVGLFQAMSRSGPMIGVALGGFALAQLGYHTTFLLLALVTSLGVALAWGLPRIQPLPLPVRPAWRAHIFGERRLVAVKSAALCNGLAFQGIVAPTVVLALAASGMTDGATQLGGVLVGLRSASDMLLAAPLGHLSDRLGRGRILPVLVALEAVAIAALAAGLSLGVALVVGLFLGLFLLSTATGTVADAAAGDLASGADRAQVMSSYATWLDLGAAIGPVLGLAIVGFSSLSAAYLTGAGVLALAALQLGLVTRARPWPTASGHAS